MGIGIEELKQLVQIFEAADEYKGIVSDVIEKGSEFVKLLEGPFEDIRKQMVENRIKSIEQVRAAGYSVEQAILILGDQRSDFRNITQLFKNK